MIVGIGLDLVELERIRSLYDRKPSFAKRVLTEREYDYFLTLKDQRKIEYLAGRFSAKEAYSKALGYGIGKEISFQDIEIINDLKGKPEIHTKNTSGGKAHLSITHTATYAAAQVVIED
ncbi:holo-ACP synthase [Evansella tamaricis]|uniref:Holo-[acyl-carrier-protein] synthase n=1 Tax=Evansella tamaricis TaxID=2069301 RepID=A0ABS6J9S3_9BACI|nr:holo-ACP synthase [Evansella tamaricis]MBU9710428.1 holo-ACP synthase [Evansella tamaricis]